MTATAPDASGDTAADRPTVAPVATARLNRLGTVPNPAPEMAVPALRDFLGGEETRLRDLLAFGMAVEAGKPPGPDGIEPLRRKADGELHAYAFRLLHNQVEEIRRQAVAEQVDRTPRPMGFGGALMANLLALVLAGLAAAMVVILDPAMPARLSQILASLFGKA